MSFCRAAGISDMGRFELVRRTHALDRAADIELFCTGQMDYVPSIDMTSAIYKIVDNKSKNDGIETPVYEYISLLIPPPTQIKVEHGVHVNEISMGVAESSSIREILECKDFCRFHGTDFDFLKYISEGVVLGESSYPSSIDYRYRVVAPEKSLNEAGIVISSTQIRTAAGMVVLAESPTT
jgi:hypothetical protein